jgi:hypothetical protein
MAHSMPMPGGALAAAERTQAERASIPWYVWCLVIGTTSAVAGGIWDISWHKSIGRDSFWTPAHLLIYLCGVLAGVGSAWMIFDATFRPASALRDASVRLWGFRGPLGAFLCAWGGAAMLVSAPFDDWWHNAYGLDVKVLSPPHVVLILGIIAIRLGTLLLVLGCMNRATGALKRRLDRLFLYLGTLLLGGTVGAFLEMTTRNYMHGARFYLLVAIIVPLCLLAVARASAHRWAATAVGAIAMGIALFFLWLLPLFPAEPKLGPVYHNVTQFIPNDFPLLVLPAAFALDLARRRIASWGPWRQALALGPLFVSVFAACQWPFANFLMSPASRNWIFGTHYLPFFVPPESDYASYRFTDPLASAGAIALAMTVAAAAAVLSARAGLGWGDWMRRIRR